MKCRLTIGIAAYPGGSSLEWISASIVNVIRSLETFERPLGGLHFASSYSVILYF